MIHDSNKRNANLLLLLFFCAVAYIYLDCALPRAYEEVREDPSREKRTKRLEKHAVGDEEMANFYAQRVALSRPEEVAVLERATKAGAAGKGKVAAVGRARKCLRAFRAAVVVAMRNESVDDWHFRNKYRRGCA